MRYDVTAYVGLTVTDEMMSQLRTRVNALGWEITALPAPTGWRVIRIWAPAAPEPEAGSGDNDEISLIQEAVFA